MPLSSSRGPDDRGYRGALASHYAKVCLVAVLGSLQARGPTWDLDQVAPAQHRGILCLSKAAHTARIPLAPHGIVKAIIVLWGRSGSLQEHGPFGTDHPTAVPTLRPQHAHLLTEHSAYVDSLV